MRNSRKKGWRFTFFVVARFLVILLITDTVWATTGEKCGPDEGAKGYDALKILLSMKDSYGTVDGYTATLVKGEPVASKSNEPQKIYVKFQKPFKVYMKWVENPHAGREVLYVAGENNDHILAKPDGFIGAILKMVKLPSDYKSAGSKHTVKDVGIGKLIDSILDITLKARDNNDLRLECKGVVVRNGREAYEIVRHLPKNGRYQYTYVLMYVDRETNLPLEAYAYDASGRLSEYCMYKDLKLNPAVKKDEFKSNNREYGFRYL